jgi:uncharacterized damage-inducible protein DinB
MSTPTTDIASILVEHDAWCTRELLLRCRELPTEALHQRFDFGLGSIHDTFLHIIAAMVRWAERIEGRAVSKWMGPEDNKTRYSVEQLLALLEDAATQLRAATHAARAEKTGEWTGMVSLGAGYVEGVDDARTSKAAALVHVTTHGTHHRSQVFQMLRRVGVSLESGQFDPVEWDLRMRTVNAHGR